MATYLMTNQEKKQKANEIWSEYKAEFTFYSSRKKAGFIRRLKNLAANINLSSSDNCEIGAMMYLDQIALWLDIDLTPEFDKG